MTPPGKPGPAAKGPPGKPVAAKAPAQTPLSRLEALTRSGYVDVNDVASFIKDIRPDKPDRATLRELKAYLLKHTSVFDRGAFLKLKAYCETYKAENDID